MDSDPSDSLVDRSNPSDKVLGKQIVDMNSQKHKVTSSKGGGPMLKIEDMKQKKKRKNKEANAGLLLPQVKSKHPQNITKPTVAKTNPMFKSKLKFLMGKMEAPKRSGLQDFLKKL